MVPPEPVQALRRPSRAGRRSDGDAVQPGADLGHGRRVVRELLRVDHVDVVRAFLVRVELVGPGLVVALVADRDDHEHVVAPAQQPLGLGAVVGLEVRDDDDEVGAVGGLGVLGRRLHRVVEVLVVGLHRDLAVAVDRQVGRLRGVDRALDAAVGEFVAHAGHGVVRDEDRDVDLLRHAETSE